MAAKSTDPTDPMRLRASRYPDVDEGTACTQSSFKTGGRSFFFVGMQGGRHKAMFKLLASRPEALALAKAEPDRYQVGADWVTARFTADAPMPTRLWQKWLDESYELARAGRTKSAAGSKKKTTRSATMTKKVVTKKAKSAGTRKKA